MTIEANIKSAVTEGEGEEEIRVAKKGGKAQLWNGKNLRVSRGMAICTTKIRVRIYPTEKGKEKDREADDEVQGAIMGNKAATEITLAARDQHHVL